ncbi:MAG TPA: RNA polymerase sigma factor [Gemmatimonadaceae bacterium]|nr:RNA polymerase sigma factor [Gemmatimonadaceae bacterium]
MTNPARHVVTPSLFDGYHRTTMTDADLVRAVLGGDDGAFTTLVDRHSRMCLRYATRMLGNEQDAEDVTQDAFVRAYRALGRFDASAEFRTWLMTILINRCRSAAGSRARRDGMLVRDDDVTASVAANGDDGATRDAIERALARLEPKQREAFLLKHIEELSYEEMRDATGVGVSALKMRVQRACERLQQLLEDDRNA